MFLFCTLYVLHDFGEWTFKAGNALLSDLAVVLHLPRQDPVAEEPDSRPSPVADSLTRMGRFAEWNRLDASNRDANLDDRTSLRK